MTEASVPVAWYSGLDLPPPGIEVWLRWGPRPPFTAALVPDPRAKSRARARDSREREALRDLPRVKGRPVCWLTHDAGRPVTLPSLGAPPDPRAPWVGWHTLQGWPDHWRPLRPDLWQVPLPPVAWIDTGEARPGRLWSATTAFAAVAEAEAREAGADASAGDAADPQWWRDPSAVTYSAPGQVTRREAEGRLMRAFHAERWVRVERPEGHTFAEALVRHARRVGLEAADVAPLADKPRGDDGDDMLTALGWLRACAQIPDARVIVVDGRLVTVEEAALRLRGAAPPRSWRQICRALGMSHKQARQTYDRALGLVTDAANGIETPGAAYVAGLLADVQERNRAARRGQ